jgi:hypothetical protein
MAKKVKKQFKSTRLNSLNKTGDELKKKIPYTKLLYTSLAANLLLILFMFFFRGNIPPEVPLFYGFPEGESQLAQKNSLVLPSLISIVVIIINSLIAYLTKDEFVKKTLVIVSFAITFLSVVTTVKIVFLVGSY